MNPLTSDKIQVGYEWLQTWIDNYYAHCYATAIDSLDNIYLAGLTLKTSSNKDTCIIKYSSSGDQILNITWSGSGANDECRGIVVDTLFNIYIAGYMFEKVITIGSSNYVIYQMYLAKFNSSGNYQWHQTWNGVSQWSDLAYGIALDISNNIYIVGECYKSQWDSDIAIIKYNSSGDEQWYRIWGGSESERGRNLSLDNLGNIYLVGSTFSFGSGRQDICLVKYDNTGVQLWNRTWGGSEDEHGSAITLDSSSNIYVAGSTESYGAGDYDMVLVKYNNLGNLQWNRTYGEEGAEGANTIVYDGIGNIYMGGRNDCDMDIVKFDTLGNLQLYGTWNAEKFGETSCDNDEYCFGIEIDSKNNIYIAGYVQPQGSAYIFCIKCTSEFISPWEKYIKFTQTIKLSDTFTTDMELDFIAGIYRDRTRVIDISYLVIGFNESVKIDVATGWSAVDSIKVFLKNKKNNSITEYSISSDSSLIVSSYKDYLFQFYFNYSYSYVSCVYSSDGIYCDEEETKIEIGEVYSEFFNFESFTDESSIFGYNLIILLLTFGGFSLILIKKRLK
ncbi:MAG: SBBP repeat-containing protein [Candidatus Hermodarchaeota archaeon]